ncbi:MAG: spondin domain-containing protein [Planctomycetota bacterium]
MYSTFGEGSARRPFRDSVQFAASLTLMYLLVTGPVVAETVTYRLTVDNTWSEATHPGQFPNNGHFSWFAGGSHSAAISFWNPGTLASPAITQMAEFGFTSLLVADVNSAIASGTAGTVLDWPYWFCPSGTASGSCGPLVVQFDIDSAFPLVTLVSMLGPTPDWFVGVSGLPLHDGNDWIDSVVVDLYPYDNGTRDQNLFLLGGPLTTPPQPISRITAASGQLIGPASLGTLHFERLDRPFTRGDVNGNGSFDLLDVVLVLDALFSGGVLPCADAADANDDGGYDITDPIVALSYLFAGASALPAPFATCAPDPSQDTLSCNEFASCP